MHDLPITTAEAAAILGKSSRTVQRMAEDGRLTYLKKLPGPNGTYLFDPAVVQRAVARRERTR